MRRSRKELLRTAQDIDLERVLTGLDSPDETIRAQAVRSLCPCRVGYAVYECYVEEVKRLQKDPSERVRKAALHVEEDAFRLEQKIHSPQAADVWQEEGPQPEEQSRRRNGSGLSPDGGASRQADTPANACQMERSGNGSGNGRDARKPALCQQDAGAAKRRCQPRPAGPRAGDYYIGDAAAWLCSRIQASIASAARKCSMRQAPRIVLRSSQVSISGL